MSAFLKHLLDNGYEVNHKHSTRGTFSQKDSTRVEISKNGEVVLGVEQDYDGKGGHSVTELYQIACLKLGLIKSRKELRGEAPIGLKITKKEQGTVHADTEFEHESFGVVTLSRFTGGNYKPFGSPVSTMGGVNITVKRARLIHSDTLNYDRIYDSHDWPIICEFSMTLTQFAEFIMSHGQGEGAPCRLEYYDGRDIESVDLPSPEDLIQEDLEKSLAQGMAEIDVIMKEVAPEMEGIGSLSAPKKREVWSKVRRAIDLIREKPEWLREQWKRNTAKAVSHARSEFAFWAERHLTERTKEIAAMAQNTVDLKLPELPGASEEAEESGQ